MSGAYKTLMQMLGESVSISTTNTSLRFGEEYVGRLDLDPGSLRSATVVPRGGPWGSPCYIRALDPSTELDWSTMESVDVYCWAVVPDGPDVRPVDQADAVEAVVQDVLRALQSQRARFTAAGQKEYGLFYKPVSGRWETLQGRDGRAPSTRSGHCYVLTIQVEIPAVTSQPVNATIETVTRNVTIQS